MEAEKKLTPLEEKWEKNRLLEDSAPKKATLDDAYTEEGKGRHTKGLPIKSSTLFLTPQAGVLPFFLIVAQKLLKAELSLLMRRAKELNWLQM